MPSRIRSPTYRAFAYQCVQLKQLKPDPVRVAFPRDDNLVAIGLIHAIPQPAANGPERNTGKRIQTGNQRPETGYGASRPATAPARHQMRPPPPLSWTFGSPLQLAGFRFPISGFERHPSFRVATGLLLDRASLVMIRGHGHIISWPQNAIECLRFAPAVGQDQGVRRSRKGSAVKPAAIRFNQRRWPPSDRPATLQIRSNASSQGQAETRNRWGQ
jgi:hypothetical protein